MHYFVGTLADNGFSVRRLWPVGGRGRLIGIGNVWRVTAVGQVEAQASGSRVVLRYALAPVAQLAALSILLVIGGRQVSSVGLGVALLHLLLVAGALSLIGWCLFRLSVRGLRSRLAVLLQLSPALATGIRGAA